MHFLEEGTHGPWFCQAPETCRHLLLGKQFKPTPQPKSDMVAEAFIVYEALRKNSAVRYFNSDAFQRHQG